LALESGEITPSRSTSAVNLPEDIDASLSGRPIQPSHVESRRKKKTCSMMKKRTKRKRTKIAGVLVAAKSPNLAGR